MAGRLVVWLLMNCAHNTAACLTREAKTTIGYARVSTTDQDLDIQIAALRREGCTMIRSEKRSGTPTAGREELRIVLDFLVTLNDLCRERLEQVR